MATPTIGIFGRKSDEHVKALVQAVEGHGATARVVDFHNFPRFNLCTLGETQSFDDLHLPDPVDLGALDAVCLRTTCFEQYEPPGERPPATTVSRFHRDQIAKVSLQTSLLRALERRIPVINPPDSFRFHRQKVWQHQRLLAHGIPTPSLVATGNVARAREFVGRVGAAVAKPQASGAEVVLADEAFFEANADTMTRRPFIFQQLVKGRSYRAYALGGEVISFGEIHYDPKYVDWRERTQRVETGDPDEAVVEWIHQATRLLDLPYCGIDIEWDAPTKRFYLLDFNPSALFVGWSRLASIDMADRIAAYLLAVIERGDPWLT